MSTTTSQKPPWSRLVRYYPSGVANWDETYIKIGEPVDPDVDVGLAVFKGEKVLVNVFSGWNILDPGEPTGEQETIREVLSPLRQEDVGTIRCIGLNYISHAKEVGLAIPTVPTLFMKPATSLADPYPQKTIVPRAFLEDDAADYEAEVALIINGPCKNVSEDEAMNYLYGITAANDVSSRKAQFAQSQWCYSKGFDGSCPIGPCVVHRDAIKDYSKVQIEAKLDDEVVQKSDLK